MKKIAFIFAQEELFWKQKAINSFKYFHPDFELINFGSKEINAYINKYNLNNINLNFRFLGPIMLRDIWENYSPDLLIKLGADCLTLGRFTEVIENNYDVACGRNDPDIIGNRDERCNRPDIIRNIPNNEWLNADLICIKSKKFLDDYTNLTLDYAFGRQQALNGSFGKVYDGDCQSALNVIIKIKNYKCHILDKYGSGVIYNSSGNWTGETDNYQPEFLEGPNHWKSWKYIYFDGEKCVMPDMGIGCGNRIVKCLHQGGGSRLSKLEWGFFNKEFQEYLKKITNIYH
jgi:hypothetical protein